MPRPKKPAPDPIVGVRFPLPVLNQIKEVAAIMGVSDQEVIRMATRIGLVRLKRINYDIAGVIDTAAMADPPPADFLRAADEPGEYQAGGNKKAKGAK